MKKYAWLFLSVFISPSFGEVISDFSNICGTYKRLYAVPKQVTCASGQFLPANALSCYACPSGYTCNGGTYSFSETKAQGLVLTGYFSYDVSNLCATNTTYRRMYAVPHSFTCASGEFLPANASTCYPCPAGYTCPGGTYFFSETKAQGLDPSGYFLFDVGKLCAANTTHYRMYAVPRSFTCASGQFLPANASTCYDCPDGYTCNGGTFAFSTTRAQGIIRGEDTLITADAHHTCSSNMGNIMNGAFEPNIITINWDDGSNTSQSQCTFGRTFDLPPAPSRPGYVFGGWRVKTNNQ